MQIELITYISYFQKYFKYLSNIKIAKIDNNVIL